MSTQRVNKLKALGMTAAQARSIDSAITKAGTPSAVDRVLDAANAALGGYGVEAIEGEWHDRYYQNIVALYVNMGDTYNTTILFDAVKGRFHVTSWGDWVERYGDELGVR